MSELRIIGIDPGPVPGIVVLGGRVPHVVQCSHEIAPVLFGALLAWPGPALVQVERFVVGRASMRAGRHGAITRDLVETLRLVWEDHDSTPSGRLGGRFLQRSAANVKPWATDARLEAAGLLEACKGMRHARDAARHALFAAVHDGGIPDPLSKEARR